MGKVGCHGYTQNFEHFKFHDQGDFRFSDFVTALFSYGHVEENRKAPWPLDK